jgi:LysR family transcriptional regulator, transcriptional activator for aaeXAB operon
MALKDLYRMAVFAKVVEKGSFSEAARILGLGKSAVSQHVSMLEDELDVKLLNRNTRSLTLTDEGRGYYESCARIVAEAERAEEFLDTARESEKGQVRMTCSYNLGLNFVVPALGEFRRDHPYIDIDLVLEDRILNMIDGGFDLSLRSGWLTDSSLYSVTLAPMRMIICASPAYLKEHEAPHRPEDFVRHDWICITGVFHPDRVALETASGERANVPLHTTFRVNSGYAARSLIISGIGIGMLPDYATFGALADGSLVRICSEWASKTGAISAVFPSKHHLSRRCRLLIDFLKVRLTDQLR